MSDPAFSVADPFGFHASLDNPGPETPDPFGGDPNAIVWGEPPPPGRTRPEPPPTMVEEAGYEIGEHEKVVFASFDLDPSTFMFAGIDTTHQPNNPNKAGPAWSIGEMAKNFFGLSVYWVRWRERLDAFVLRGKPVADRRKGPIDPKTGKPRGRAYYHLEDVELLCHALYEKSMISHKELYRALIILNQMGKIHGYLEDPS